MGKKDENYEYLLKLYTLVDDFIGHSKYGNFPEAVVAFCVVTEKILKIRLYKENPILVYENSKFKETDFLIAVLKEKELDAETIRVKELLYRYNLMFQDGFSDNEILALNYIYKTRNHFIHGCKSDDLVFSDQENIINKMGSVWEKISSQAVSLFSKAAIKASRPKKKYSEEQLDQILIEEVRKKIINNKKKSAFSLSFSRSSSINLSPPFSGLYNDACPRCGAYGFTASNLFPAISSSVSLHEDILSLNYLSDLYQCKECNLELTKKEYEIAKKIKNKE